MQGLSNIGLKELWVLRGNADELGLLTVVVERPD